MSKTTAKIKGCYHCSQRRVNCDRTEPFCLKCLKKGLKCPGLGTRYRFNNGVAARGKFKGKAVLAEDELVVVPENGQLPPIKWVHQMKPSSSFGLKEPIIPNSLMVNQCSSLSRIKPSQIHSIGFDDQDNHVSGYNEIVSGDSDAFNVGSHRSELFCQVNNQMAINDETTAVYQSWPLLGLDTHDAVTRMLLFNFSENVAKAMVVFDDPFNNYRLLILPLADENDLVRNAVLAASSNQLASRSPEFARSGLKYQAAAIKALPLAPESVKSQTTEIIAAIAILLINEMTSGGVGEFQALYKMMKSCVSIEQSNSGSFQTTLGLFLCQQLRIMEFFIQIFLGEEIGVWNLISRFLGPIEFLAEASLQHPDRADTVRRLEDVLSQASDIYLQRAMNNLPSEGTVPKVQRLKESIEAIPPGSPGEHVLVWAYFIAGAESSIIPHREFFQERLRQLYSKTGFSNILRSLQMLERIWANYEKSWTKFIIEIEQAFIM